MKNYQIVSELGTGSFGKVQLAIHEPTGEKVAIKTISKKKLITKQDIQMVNKQIAVFKCVNHPNIIKLFEIAEDQHNLHLIMEHADKGDLLTFIKNNGTLTEPMALNFIKQLAQAVQYIHGEKSIAHRDIKLANVLITSKNNNIKLADFGLSNFYDKDKLMLKTCCGSPCYSAPEILIGCQYNPIVADIWSLGVVLYSMVEGCLPFYHENVKQLYKQVIKGNYCEHENASKQLRVLIRKILQINPDSRIKMAQLVKQIDRLIQIKNNNRMMQMPILTNQSNDYVNQARHQNIKKILRLKGFQESQVNQALQFRRNYSRPRKFNTLNTFIELLERKTFNKLTLFLNDLQGENKQNQSKANSLLKRNFSTFTRDTLKNSHAEDKGNRVRFVRKGKNINLFEPQFNKQASEKVETSVEAPKHRRKHSEIYQSLKQGTQRTARMQSIENQIKNGYIRININQQKKLNTQNTEVVIEKNSATCRTRNSNLSLSFSNKPNPKVPEYKMKMNQSINQSVVNSLRQERMAIHQGLFNIMHTFNGEVNNEEELLHSIRKKFKEVQVDDTFKYIVKQDSKQQAYQIGIFRLQNFSTLKYIKIEPFNSQVMYEVKKILSGLERST